MPRPQLGSPGLGVLLVSQTVKDARLRVESHIGRRRLERNSKLGLPIVQESRVEGGSVRPTDLDRERNGVPRTLIADRVTVMVNSPRCIAPER